MEAAACNLIELMPQGRCRRVEPHLFARQDVVPDENRNVRRAPTRGDLRQRAPCSAQSRCEAAAECGNASDDRAKGTHDEGCCADGRAVSPWLINVSGRRAPILVGIVALLALAVGFAAGGKLESLAFLSYAEHATGLRLDASDVTRTASGYLLRDMTASTHDGALLVSAARARLALGASGVTIELEHPHIVVSPLRYHAEEEARLPLGNRAMHVTIRDGTLVMTSGTVPVPVLTCEDINADVHSGPTQSSYDVAMGLIDGTNRYPVTGHAGHGASMWTAAAVPLEPFAALLPDDAPLRLRSGWLRDLEIDGGPAPHGAARLDDASVTFGEQHELRGLHGKLVFSGDGIGSREIAGRLDDVPFDFAGELHALFGAHPRGVRDLDARTALLTRIANEPRLRSVKLEATAPGLAYAEYALASDHGPLAISLLALDPAEPTLRFDTVIAEDRVVSGGERTSAMSVRTGAVAGVNGDYFDIGRSYQPQGMLVRHGELVRGPTDRAALVIDRNKQVTIAEFHIRGEVRTAQGSMPITEVNDWPPGDVCVITPAFGKVLPASPGRTFVALQPLGGGNGTRFRVTDIVPMDAPTMPRFGIAIGPLVRTPLPARGEIVSLSYALEPYVNDVVAGIGGGPVLLRNGAWFEDRHAPAPDERGYRWPVIALVRTGDGRLMFVAVDGRHPERSVGMTRPEFGALLLRLGGVDAMALDSGGSVTLVSRAPGDANASVRNVPSDNSAERWVSDGLFLYSSAPPPTLVAPAQAATPVPEVRPSP